VLGKLYCWLGVGHKWTEWKYYGATSKQYRTCIGCGKVEDRKDRVAKRLKELL